MYLYLWINVPQQLKRSLLKETAERENCTSSCLTKRAPNKALRYTRHQRKGHADSRARQIIMHAADTRLYGTVGKYIARVMRKNGRKTANVTDT
jgi:hypothetical protein